MTYIKTIAARPGEECLHIEMTADEVTVRQAEEAAFLANHPKLEIIAQIEKLESLQTPRRIRAAALGRDAGYLSDLENQIAQLRNQLS